MSKHNNYHNYSNYGNKSNEATQPATLDETPIAPTVEETKIDDITPNVPELIVDNTTTPEEPKKVTTGTVNRKLNIRKSPDSYGEILTVVPGGTVLEIDLDCSTDEWYAITTPTGTEGWCMCEFVTLK